jgi:DNA repair exonuclease SbcCD ATPase subunit
MKLTMKNFRCYENKSFDFVDDTTTLVSGPSGKGKTSILLAIKFALYGSSNHKNLVSYGKSSCEVTLTIKISDKLFKIKRTKRPNILNVSVDGHLYEDKDAQALLMDYFGHGGGSTVSFMDMSHLERVEFLERITNSECDVNHLKDIVKSEVATLGKERTLLDGQISNAYSMVDIVQKPSKVNKPELDVEIAHMSDMSPEDVVSNQLETLTQLEQLRPLGKFCDTLISELNFLEKQLVPVEQDDDIDGATRKLHELEAENTRLDGRKQKFFLAEEAEKELRDYDDVCDKTLLELEARMLEIDDAVAKRSEFDKVLKAKNLKDRYDQDSLAEYQEWHAKVLSYQQRLDELKKVEEDLGDSKKPYEVKLLCAKHKEAREFILLHDYDDVTSRIAALESAFLKKYECSECGHETVIDMNSFKVVAAAERGAANSSTADVESLILIKTQLEKLQILRNNWTANNEFVQSQNNVQLEARIDRLEQIEHSQIMLAELGSDFTESKYLKKLRREIKTLQSSLKSVEDDDYDGSALSVDELKDLRRDAQVERNHIFDKLKIKAVLLRKVNDRECYDELHHSKILKELKERKDLVAVIKKNNTIRADIKAKFDELRNVDYRESSLMQLEQQYEQLNMLALYHEKYTAYKAFQSSLQKYKSVKANLTTLLDQKKSVDTLYSRTLVFRQKVVESEHESLANMVGVVNSHLSILLKDFFSESFGDPIQVRLELTNDRRQQVDIVVDYKGNRIDYKSLSTGEYARLKLAFDLTFKEILGERIITLDECTSNLDQDLSTGIFAKIRDTFPAKTILVVAHQVVTGTFDDVLYV